MVRPSTVFLWDLDRAETIELRMLTGDQFRKG